MSWTGLGSITPSFVAWQSFDSAVIDNETFKLNFSNLPTVPKSYLLIRLLFVTGETGKAIRIYPDNQEITFDLLVPQGLRDAGQLVYHLQVKKFWRRRRYIGAQLEPNWTVSAFEYHSDAPPNPDTNEQMAQLLAEFEAMEAKVDQVLEQLTE